MSDVTQIISRIESGDGKASDELFPLVYQELRRLAEAKLAREKPGQTLQVWRRLPVGSRLQPASRWFN